MDGKLAVDGATSTRGPGTSPLRRRNDFVIELRLSPLVVRPGSYVSSMFVLCQLEVVSGSKITGMISINPVFFEVGRLAAPDGGNREGLCCCVSECR